MHGIAFAELAVFLENASSDENSLLSLDSGTLLKLYKDRLEHIGVTLDSRIHNTRLKDRLMAELSEFRAH